MTETNLTTASTLAPTAPLPAREIASYDSAPVERRAEIDQALAEIALDDSTSILFFGTTAQESVTTVADEMLEGVRNKDTAAAGQALNDLVTTLRGLPVAELDAKQKTGLLGRLFRGVTPIAKMLQQYEQVRSQVDAISNRLDGHTSKLMKDIGMLDRLYDKTLEYFRRLEVYIAAGAERLRRLDTETLPTLARDVEQSNDVLKAQQLGDLRAKRDDLE